MLLSVYSLKAQESDYDRKNLLKELRGYMKADNYSKVDNALKSAMAKYSEAKSDAELYNMWMNANYNLALAENKKIYLSSSQDTVKYMDYIYNTFAYGVVCDSLDRLPNHKGKIKRKFRDNIKERLNFFQKNMENAGRFFYRRKDYKRAYSCIDLYLKVKYMNNDDVSFCDSLVEAKHGAFEEKDKKLVVLAVFSAYSLDKYENVVKYYPLALDDSVKRSTILELACKSFEQLGMVDKYSDLLEYGFERYSVNEYFFASLIKLYNDKKDYETALRFARDAVYKNPGNRNYWFVKATEEQMLELVDSAIISYSNAIKIQPADAESYSCIADIYLKKAHDEDKRLTISFEHSLTPKEYSTAKAKLKSLYIKACENYELARVYGGELTDLWLEGLKECYYKLNRGKDLRDLETQGE